MNSARQPILTDRAPKGRGPFPQALRVGQFVFVSGQGPLDPATNAPILGSFSDQVHRAFDNLEAVLAAARLDMSSLAKVTVYLSDLDNIPTFNVIYEKRVPSPFPARTLVQAGLRGIDVEIDVIAIDPHSLAAEQSS
jgi:2-iminobutanoate/2-iminopropanoate deaminase